MIVLLLIVCFAVVLYRFQVHMGYDRRQVSLLDPVPSVTVLRYGRVLFVAIRDGLLVGMVDGQWKPLPWWDEARFDHIVYMDRAAAVRSCRVYPGDDTIPYYMVTRIFRRRVVLTVALSTSYGYECDDIGWWQERLGLSVEELFAQVCSVNYSNANTQAVVCWLDRNIEEMRLWESALRGQREPGLRTPWREELVSRTVPLDVVLCIR